VNSETWPRIAVMGAGAVGCYFGSMLARAGAPVTLIGRPLHVEAIQQNGLWLESMSFQERVNIAASDDATAARGAGLILFCVKTLDTEEAARALAHHLSPGSVVLSMQNGVDNVERIRAATRLEALAAVVYVAAAMTGPGRVRHTGRGDLVLGDPKGGRQAELDRLAAMFIRAQIPCLVSVRIDAELWTKMTMNCAYNAVSALGRSRYGPLSQHPLARHVLRQAVEETVAVARGLGIQLQESDLIEAALRLGEAMPQATSSTAQDIARGKRTEIDSLNGHVVRCGGRIGVATPVNWTLWALVKLLEGAEEKSA
jgi:2-dehydropantoate 2-reductase